MRALLMATTCILFTAGCRSTYFGNPFIASAQSRAEGGCYSQCRSGWQCNVKTGLCEEIPARQAELELPGIMAPDGGTPASPQ